MKMKAVFKYILLILVCFIFFLNVFLFSNKSLNNIRAIGYPQETIQINRDSELIIMRLHDLKNDTIYLDTILKRKRKISTIEEYNSTKF